MENKKFTVGEVLYSADRDTVEHLDIVVKGMVRAYNDYCSIDMPPGSIIGLGEECGGLYTFHYEACTDGAIFSYPYASEAELVALYKANPKLLGTLVAASVRFTYNLHQATLDAMEIARSEYRRVRDNEAEYPGLAVAAGAVVRKFPELGQLEEPSMQSTSFGWHGDFITDLFARDADFRKDLYSIPSIGLGMGLTINRYALEDRDYLQSIFQYLGCLQKTSADFTKEYNAVKETVQKHRDNAVDISSTLDASVTHCLATLKDVGKLDEELFERFGGNLEHFSKAKDRYDRGDEMRKLRREISNDFYKIYEEVFLHTVGTPFTELPLGVKLFLMFGFVSEELAGIDNTVKLAAIASSYQQDKSHRVVTLYEWLMLVYTKVVMPSRDEFDLDYPEFLAEQRRNGEINSIQEKDMLQDPLERFRFELRNMAALGNRITFGLATTFVPVFDRENAKRDLEQAYLSADILSAQIEKIHSIDYRVFCRQSVYSAPALGINSFFLDNEVSPYIILMPNIGFRASLWQVIEGKKRNTPGRMLVSIFHTEDIEDTMIKLAAEFRWEMCRMEQGVHWNDVSDPSLTAMYCDYLQFYRKNSSLSQEVREKISASLKSNSNSFKKVFVSDYLTYIKYEANGAARMNKVAREILFNFCPFSKEIRQKFMGHPLYAKLVEQHNARTAKKLKPLRGVISKIQNSGQPVPEELLRQETLLLK